VKIGQIVRMAARDDDQDEQLPLLLPLKLPWRQ
jgi:hypothetical protein